MNRVILFSVLVPIALVWLGVRTFTSNSPSLDNNQSAPKTFISPTSFPTTSSPAQNVAAEVVVIESRSLDRTIQLSGELRPYLSVDINPKVTGIVDWIGVDRGSIVKKGDLLIRLSAPELRAQGAEAEAQLRGAEITYSRLHAASATPGVVAGNDLELAQHKKEAFSARMKSLRDMENYLKILAPFSGVVVQRNIHPGAIVGPAAGAGQNAPLLILEQVSHLRLIVPVPEVYSGSIAKGTSVQFTVPAYPDATFTGVISRVSRSIDQKTRTMPVEMDVDNSDGRLASGMFPEVRWPVKRQTPTLFVPLSSIATTTEQTFIVRIENNKAQWVPIKKGTVSGTQVEVFGALHAGDKILLRGTDEIRPGTRVDPMVRQEHS